MDTILNAVICSQTSTHLQNLNRPFILLTWAQSLDGKLAAAPGMRTPISGELSMAMTHALRALHDAILVGIGTVLADDPRLTCRLSEPNRTALRDALVKNGRGMPDDVSIHPQAVVLDANLRTPPSSKFLRQPHIEESRRQPIIFVANEDINRGIGSRDLAKLCVLEQVKSRVKHGSIRLDLQSAMHKLFNMGLRSVMVEGGASVIASFLEAGLCDFIIVTVSPSLFGSGLGLSAADGSNCAFRITQISDPKWLQLGDDIIVMGAIN